MCMTRPEGRVCPLDSQLPQACPGSTESPRSELAEWDWGIQGDSFKIFQQSEPEKYKIKRAQS